MRREGAFFPNSTEQERLNRAADGYNNASMFKVPKECWIGGKVLERYSKL